VTKEAVFETWAPRESVWSRFAKPTLFSFMDDEQMHGSMEMEKDWGVALERETALFVDVAGREGVAIGLIAAERGYRPVPLYNACPFPFSDLYPANDITSILTVPRPESLSAPTAVEVVPIMASLYEGAGKLAQFQIQATAPPVFLVDANRLGHVYFVPEGWFDNRSMLSALDLPSADLLKERGLKRIVLVQTSAKPQRDLLFILIEWQTQGVQMMWQRPWEAWGPKPIVLKRLSPPRALFNRIALAFRHRRHNKLGAFGRMVPHAG